MLESGGSQGPQEATEDATEATPPGADQGVLTERITSKICEYAARVDLPGAELSPTCQKRLAAIE